MFIITEIYTHNTSFIGQHLCSYIINSFSTEIDWNMHTS